jgi:hypothetical protein
MMSRMSLTGHVFIGLGDAVVGLLLGLGALSVTGGTFLPLVQALLGKGTGRKVAGGLMAVGALVAVGCSVGGVFPYSGAKLILIAAMVHRTFCTYNVVVHRGARPVALCAFCNKCKGILLVWNWKVHVHSNMLLTVCTDCCCMLQPPCPSA